MKSLFVYKLSLVFAILSLVIACNEDDNDPVVTSCEEPTNLQLISVTDEDALIQWNFGTNYTDADIEYGPSGFTLGSGRVAKSLNGQFRMMDLIQDTQYDAYVTANCGTNTQSSTVGPITFQTLLPCDPPTSLNVSSPSPGDISISWGPFVEGYQWELEYGVSGFLLGEGTVLVVSQPSAFIENLEPNTYSFYVKSICAEDFESTYIGPVSFTLE